MAVDSANVNRVRGNRQSGFTLMQLLIVVMVIGVIGGMAAFGIAEARQRIRLTNSARLLASYLEKARVDSIRRHAVDPNEMAGVTFTSATSYQVRLDFDGNGTVETREISFDSGIFVVNEPLPVPTRFNWRGRFQTDDLTITKNTITLQYGNDSDQRRIDVTRSGDVTVDSREYLDDVPNVNVTTDLSPTDSTVNGNSNSPNPHPTPTPDTDPDPDPGPTPNPPPTPDPNPTPNPSPTPDRDPTPDPSPSPSPDPTPYPSPSPSPDPTPAPCEVDITPPAPSISKHGGSTTLTFTVTGGSGAVGFVSGPSNIEVIQISAYDFRITSLNNSRGDFTLNFHTPCGPRKVIVSITN